MSVANLHGRKTDGTWVPILVDDAGGMSGSGTAGQLPATTSTVQQWRYAAASGGIVNTSDVAIAAAPGIGKANYLTSIQIVNSHATVSTEVVIKNGSTVIWRRMFPALSVGAADIVFERPLYASNNTALNVAAITDGAAVYVNAQGYVEASYEMIQGFVTGELELFDGAGALLTDGAGSTLYVPNYLI